MSYLNYISDEDLKRCVKNLWASVKTGIKKTDSSLGRNVIDPFSAFLGMAILQCDREEWIAGEKRRQAEKALTNAVGTFHQQILGCIPGWEDLKTTNQVDLVNNERRIIAEIKNKFNTLNASGGVSLHKRLSAMVSPKNSVFKGYTAYYVTIVPKGGKRFDSAYAPSDNSTGDRCQTNESIRIIDGYSFYALATGEDSALSNLFSALPAVVADVSGFTPGTAEINFARSFFDKVYFA